MKDPIFEELNNVSKRFDLEHDRILKWAPFYLVSQDGFMPDLTRELYQLKNNLEESCIFTPRKGDVLQLFAEYDPSSGLNGTMKFREKDGRVLTDLLTWLRQLFLDRRIDDAVVAIYIDDNDIPETETVWDELLRMLFSFKNNCLILIIGDHKNNAKLRNRMKGWYFYRELDLQSPSDRDNIDYFLNELEQYKVPCYVEQVQSILLKLLKGKGWQDRKSLVLLRCELNWRIGTGNVGDNAEEVGRYLSSDDARKYFAISYDSGKHPARHIGFAPFVE